MAFVPALAIGGAAISAIGAITGGIANKNNANYQATVAANNATIAQQNATYAEQAGSVAAENEGRKGAAALGKLKTTQAASGVNVNTGSAVDVQVGERETNQLNTETVMSNAELKAYGYRTQATGFQAESQLDTAKADQAIPGAALSAAGGLLGSASSLGGKWSGTPGTGGTPPLAVANYNSGNPVY